MKALPIPAETLQRLVAECIGRMESEGPSAVEELLREHPEAAERVRSRLCRLRDAGLLPEPSGDAARFPERLGPFRLLERIGGGGMGVVYLAEQEPLGRRVAVKVVRPDLVYFAGALERFRREVEAAALLKHPGIVPVYTVGEADGVPYYAMELVEGRSLDEVLSSLRRHRPAHPAGLHLLRAAREGRCEEPASSEAARALLGASWVDACLRIVLQVALALDHAHRRGVLHRDLKPSNVMLASDGRALLFDFGLACTPSTSHLTRTGSQVGSLPYMAPEQLRGEEIDERTDLYGLGVTLYELLGLAPPYLARDPEETRRRILAGSPSSLRRGTCPVPRDVETVCRKAMDRDKERRYASAAELADDLRAALERRPVKASPPGPLLRARRFSQRRPTLCTGVALSVLLVAGSTAFALRERAANRALAASGRAKDALVAELREAGAAREAALAQTEEALRTAGLAEARAREELRTSEAILAFLDEDLLRSASPKVLGRDVTVREALDAASAGLEGRFGDRPLVEAAIRATLGATYLDLGSLDAAERELLRARALVETALVGAAGGRGSPVALEVAASLADLAFERGRPAEAVQAYEEVLEGRRALLGSDDPRTLVSQSNLGGLLAVSGRPAEGLPLLREAADELERRVGEGDLRALAAQSNLATALQRSGRIDEALAVAERSARLSLEHLGEGNGHTSTALHNLATILLDAGRPEEALPLLERALELKVRALGWAHAQTLGLADSLCALQQRLGRHDDAERTLERAFDGARAAGADDAFPPLGLLHAERGQLLFERGSFAGAAEAYAHAREGLLRCLGDVHPRTLQAIGGLGWALARAGDAAGGERFLREALACPAASAHQRFGWLLGRVDCLVALGRLEEAEVDRLDATELLSGEDDPRAAEAARERARALYSARGEPGALQAWLELAGDR